MSGRPGALLFFHFFPDGIHFFQAGGFRRFPLLEERSFHHMKTFDEFMNGAAQGPLRIDTQETGDIDQTEKQVSQLFFLMARI